MWSVRLRSDSCRPVDTHLYSPMNNRRDGEERLARKDFDSFRGPLDVYRRMGTGTRYWMMSLCLVGAKRGRSHKTLLHTNKLYFLSRGVPSPEPTHRAENLLKEFLYYLFREGWGEWCSFTVSDLYQRSIFEREYINFLYPVSPTGPPLCSSIASCHLYFAPSAGRRQSGWRQKWAARRCEGGVRFPDRMS